MRVEVVYCPRPGEGEVDVVVLDLPAGSTLRTAVEASGIAARHGLAPDVLVCGVWGQRAGLDQGLRERDRVELYRPLQCDPKEARRTRGRMHKPDRKPGARRR
jgi:uncharacterized protein